MIFISINYVYKKLKRWEMGTGSSIWVRISNRNQPQTMVHRFINKTIHFIFQETTVVVELSGILESDFISKCDGDCKVLVSNIKIEKKSCLGKKKNHLFGAQVMPHLFQSFIPYLKK